MSAQSGEPERYVAQRSHRAPCDLCSGPIVVGEQCVRWVWFDDVPVSIRVHAACQDEARRYDWYDDPDGWGVQFPLREERVHGG